MQMRWADLDQLGHINNVSYVRYADEARRDLAARDLIDPNFHIDRCDVEFLVPMHLSLHPIYVTGSLDGDRLTQEICHRKDGEVTIYARVTTDLAAQRSPFGGSEAGDAAPAEVAWRPLALRRGDTDNGMVGNANHFELLQESRILAMADILTSVSAGGYVVARVAIDYADDLPWRSTPYTVGSWVERVGRSSVQLVSEIRDDNTTYSRTSAILVGFDAEQQKSRPLTDEERSRLAEATHGV